MHNKTFIFFLMSMYTAAFALNEDFFVYNSPQALAMGNAMTADAYGYLSNYYNPAGHAKLPAKKYEVNLFDFEAMGSAISFSKAISAQTLSTYRFFKHLTPNDYTYFNFNSVPSFSKRNFGISYLINYQYAALADETRQVDVNSHFTMGPVIGFSKSLGGNVIKVGGTVKALVRNQLKGIYDLTTLDGDDVIASKMQEGLAVGADLGVMFTWPGKYLPTLGFSWTDATDTRFITETHVLNTHSQGLPANIAQAINAGFSLHPYVTAKLKTLLSIELKHIEQPSKSFRKRLHIGFQLANNNTFFVWAGLNQLYPTFGIALRLPGGNLEMGTYAVDIGTDTESQSDRRYFFRYTISF